MENTNRKDVARTLGIDDNSGKIKPLNKWLIAGFLLILFAAAGFFLKSNDQSDAFKYTTQSAYKGNLIIKVSATGTLVPTNKVEVGSELSGIIRTVEVDYNDKVKPGQVMARLDNSRLKAEVMKSRAALASAKAKLLSAKADLWKTQRKFLRLKKAWEKSHHKIPSLDEMDNVKAAFESAKASIAVADAGILESEATLKGFLTDLSKTVIYSPINGIVLTRNIEPGQTVAASFQAPVLFTLAEDLTRMELHVDVDEADVGKVHAGQTAVFTVDAYPDRSFSGKILNVHYGSKTTEGIVTYETVIQVKNKDLALLPGMTASSDITVKEFKKVLLIPNAALRFTPPEIKKSSSGTGFLKKLMPHRPFKRPARKKPENNINSRVRQVWTITDQGKLSALKITIGETNGDVTQVVKGNIKPGMLLVTNAEKSK